MSWIDAQTTCLVTGGSAGIGLETARGLAQLGATVIITGRNPERTSAAVAAIRQSSGHERVSHQLADFSSLQAVRQLASDVTSQHQSLHVLVNNAGLWHPQRKLSDDGYEDTFAVNHLAPFLLTNALLPLLRRGAQERQQARIVVVSSRLHRKAKSIQWDDIHSEHYRKNGLAAYEHSKLANVLFSRELARRLQGTGITCNAVHPGSVATQVTRKSRLARWGQWLIRPFLSSPAQGAATSLHVATSDAVHAVSGAYFARSRQKPASRAACSDSEAQRLWRLSEQLTGFDSNQPA